MRMIGLVLIVLGILGFVYGGFSYTKNEKVLDVGPIEATVEEKKRVPVPQIASGVAILAGIILVSRRPKTA